MSRNLTAHASPHPGVRGSGMLARLRAKAWWLRYHASEYAVELIGHIPSHLIRNACYRHLFGITIGVGASIHRACRFHNPRGVTLGDHSIVNDHVLLDGRAGVSIGSNASVSEGAWILSLEHDVDDAAFGTRGGAVTIGDYSFIGARAIILPGVSIGEGAVVAAGAVVTRSVEPYAIVAGNPATVVRYRSRDLTYQLVYRKFLG